MIRDREHSLEPVLPFTDFREASSAVLELLQERIGMDLWLVTRVQGEDWIVLSAQDRGYDVKAGDIFRWSDSFCSRMVQALGPRIAPRSDDVPIYAQAPIAQQIPISAYVGVPISRPDGSLFGTLCAVDPEPQASSLSDQAPVLELYSRLLASILDSEIQLQRQVRRAERAELESERDALTGTHNRRGWERLCAAEEERCRRYGSSVAVVVVDVDGLKRINDEQGHRVGDELLRRCAEALDGAIRSTDILARLGGDEFGVLAIEETKHGLQRLVARVSKALANVSIEASVGGAVRQAGGCLATAQQEADEAMYRSKRAKRDGLDLSVAS